ncbi:STAS domain-containing protein [Candidatus Riflebacteria bacterium]
MTSTSPQFQTKIRKVQLSVIVTVIELSGELDSLSTPTFRKMVYDVMEGLNPYIVLNLKSLVFINSQSLGVIVKAIKRLSKMKSGKLVLCQVHPNLEMLFEMINPGIPVPNFVTEDGALNEFQGIKSEFEF